MPPIVLALAASLDAHAVALAEPPAGARRVGVLLCPDDGACADDMAYLATLDLPPLVVVDGLVPEGPRDDAEREAFAARFVEDVAKARRAVVEARDASARAALEDARWVLAHWDGVPDNADLFDLYYLEGLSSGNASDFQQAAAVAWNRTAKDPVGDAEGWEAYITAVDALIDEGTGRLALERSVGASWALDGVELGDGNWELTLFPGTHRLTATLAGGRTWHAEVRVHAGRTTHASADFTDWTDDRVTMRLLEALAAGRMDPATAALVEAWATEHRVREVALVYGGDGALRMSIYDPALRRFVPATFESH